MQCSSNGSITSAEVDLVAQNNATWNDAFQFGDEDDTTWSFTGMTFMMDVKDNVYSTTARLALTSGAGEIVVDDEAKRVLHLNVTDTTIKSDLPPATYVYDLIMLDGSTPPVRVALMHGTVTVTQGATGDA